MTFFTNKDAIEPKKSVLFTRADAINCRDAELKERTNIQSLLKHITITPETILDWFKFEIRSNPNKERYQYELYSWDTIECGSMAQSMRNQLEEALAKKYLPFFPDCEITYYKKDHDILFVMNLYMGQQEQEQEEHE